MRNAFLLKLRPGCAEEYRRRHAAIWPDMLRALRNAGVANYTIWLDSRSGTLFAQRIVAAPERLDALRRDPVFQRWQESMAELLDPDPDGCGPVTVPLEELFHLD